MSVSKRPARLAEAVAVHLHTDGHKVSVVNPARIHAYGKSMLRRNKTDKLDAELMHNSVWRRSRSPGHRRLPPSASYVRW